MITRFRQLVSPLCVTALAIFASADRSYPDCNAIYEEATNLESRALGEARNAAVAFEELLYIRGMDSVTKHHARWRIWTQLQLSAQMAWGSALCENVLND